DGAGGTGVDAMRTMGKEDVLIAVSIEPYTRQTLHAVEFAAERKVGIIALTDSCLSPIARLAATSIIVATGSPSFFQTLAPALRAGGWSGSAGGAAPRKAESGRHFE